MSVIYYFLDSQAKLYYIVIYIKYICRAGGLRVLPAEIKHLNLLEYLCRSFFKCGVIQNNSVLPALLVLKMFSETGKLENNRKQKYQHF